MNGPDLNIEYNARLTVLDHKEKSARWERDAEQYRGHANAELDIAYGNGSREKYDFFPSRAGAPICAFIHGGYWRSRDRKTFSYIAKGLNARGISVAIPSYDLVPNVTLLKIVDQMRAFLVKLWRNTQVRPVVAGHSAGGQNSTGALLFHPDFYTVAVSSDGCHDNRMDKISWNEQWMGYPLGPHYAESSNVVNAHKLQGKLFLIVGELDTKRAIPN